MSHTYKSLAKPVQVITVDESWEQLPNPSAWVEFDPEAEKAKAAAAKAAAAKEAADKQAAEDKAKADQEAADKAAEAAKPPAK